MNIFFLDRDPAVCAQMHCNKHVVKMLLETAQLLSVAHRILDSDPYGSEILYRVTHPNHPCAVWTRATSGNYTWLLMLFEELCLEYTHRYGKVHKTEQKLASILTHLPKNIEQGEFFDPPQCMPDECKKDDVVEAYRTLYRHKSSLFDMVWTNRNQPDWF